ncbi:hypothetical protein CS063_00565 [Sporanaerobium hydrogeniformans]|uniref:Uncharacterized protein n=1 Tax=Sporanaerobium hydrogeniformans TaxID=3072179 RepID=A0AC61DIU0_9FIRM|nr:sugar ABC transporter ATP-binding protein [Sporanaerobium hydrogeniformans]PHV72002.1 hypothetical protein CS063_00565 [Sporanaerobium hydrogeniformans]
MDYLLELKAISSQLSDTFALKEINLNLLPQEVHVIIGQNGSGKSALMKIIAGLISDYTGQVFIQGEPVIIPSLLAAKALGIFYAPQEVELFEDMTVAENLFFESINKNKLFIPINYPQLYAQAQNLLDQFEINLSSQTLVEDLSLAHKHLLQILKAYVCEARIVILDEPSAAFTDYESAILHTIIRHLQAKKVGIFFISHRLSDIDLLGNRVSIIKDGHLLATLHVDESVNEEIIYLLAGTSLSNRYPKLHFNKGDVLLKVQNLQSSDILTRISFSLHQHEILGITGLAGSGRTLLANCLFGNAPYTCEHLEVNGQLLQIKHPTEAISHLMALLPEDRNLHSILPSLDVADNIAFTALSRFSHLYHINYEMLHATVQDYLKRFNIEACMYESIHHFNPSIQQKMLLSKWIMNQAKIFILDEPTRGVDIPNKIDMYNCMNDMIKKGAGIILISSDFDEILGMCDRILILSQGQLIHEMSHKEATKELILKYAISPQPSKEA